MVTRRLCIFRDTIPGSCAASWYSNPEVAQPPDDPNPEIVQPPGIVTRKSVRKKTFFLNISTKTKMFSKIFWDVDLGPSYYRFMKKRGQKSHATVPLTSTI